MEKYLELYNKYRDYILFFIIFIIMIIGNIFTYWYFTNDLSEIKNKTTEKITKEKPTKKTSTEYIVDIKGEVKKPGVYTLNKNDRVIDVVKKAGGFTKYADPSVNNLSKKIKDEMVIVIYSKNEITDYLKTKEKEEQIKEKCNNDITENNSCIENDEIENYKENDSTNNSNTKETEEKTKLVNINTASKEELMTISGIGSAKADAIISYRKENKFEKPEDIKNVSGIGDSVYEKIKEFITT